MLIPIPIYRSSPQTSFYMYQEDARFVPGTSDKYVDNPDYQLVPSWQADDWRAVESEYWRTFEDLTELFREGEHLDPSYKWYIDELEDRLKRIEAFMDLSSDFGYESPNHL